MRKVSARQVALTKEEITSMPNFVGLLVLRKWFSPSVGFADSSLQQSRAACSPRPARAKPLVSSAALPELCFAKSPVRTIRWSQGTGLLRTCGMSMKALNLWAFMRGLELSNNRIETKNSCLLNLWRQEFVLSSTAVTGRGHCPQTKNPRPSNLWGRGFVLSSAAAAGCRLSLP